MKSTISASQKGMFRLIQLLLICLNFEKRKNLIHTIHYVVLLNIATKDLIRNKDLHPFICHRCSNNPPFVIKRSANKSGLLTEEVFPLLKLYIKSQVCKCEHFITPERAEHICVVLSCFMVLFL